MLQIECPWCGPRDEQDFSYGGEAHIVRPKQPEKLDDAQWADYLFMRKNPKGEHLERWVCNGCRRWFNVRRNTVTDVITAVYKIGAQAPAMPKKAVREP